MEVNVEGFRECHACGFLARPGEHLCPFCGAVQSVWDFLSGQPGASWGLLWRGWFSPNRSLKTFLEILEAQRQACKDHLTRLHRLEKELLEFLAFLSYRVPHEDQYWGRTHIFQDDKKYGRLNTRLTAFEKRITYL